MNARPRRRAVLAAIAVAALLLPATAFAAGDFHGHSRFEKIKGDPSKGHIENYEYKAFLTGHGTASGVSYHIGDPGTADHPYTGCVTLANLPAGPYTFMTSWGHFPWRGKIVPGIVINNNQTTQANAEEPIDFSAYYTKSQWDPTGANPILQTFLATGTSITRVVFAKADSNSNGSIVISVHQSNGGNVETWPQVGPSRTINRAGSGNDHWASWNAGEIPTIPGVHYAVRLYGTHGNIQPYWSDDVFYTDGAGYRGSQSSPAGHDYHIAVFSDNDDTLHTLAIRSPGYGNLGGWRERWAQSYTALGTSFAGAALMGTIGGASGWQFTVNVSLHSGSPDGAQVGPTKTMPCAFAPFAGVAGAAFAEGEAPTTIGQQYWIVYQRDGGGGFNAYRMNEGDTYSGGSAAYSDSGSGPFTNQSFDLFMSIYEYAAAPEPTPTPIPGANLLVNGSFEQTPGSIFPGWTNNSGYGANGTFPNPGGAQDGSQWASFSYGGGDTVIQDLYQTVSVTSGQSYHLSTFADLGGSNGSAAARILYSHGGYPGKGNGALLDEIVWNQGQSSTSWTPLGGYVTASQNQLTFILRTQITGWGAGANYDNCALLEQVLQDTPTPTPVPTNTPTPTNTPSPTATPTSTSTPSPTPSPTPDCSPVAVDDPFSSTGSFDANWIAYGSSPARYIKNEWWCNGTRQHVEIQSANGGYYRVFGQGVPGGAYTVTVDRVRGNNARTIRVDSNGGTNPSVYDKEWVNSAGSWQCETPSALTGTVGASGAITVFLGTTNNGQFEHLRVAFECPSGPPPPTPTPTHTPTPTATPTATATPDPACSPAGVADSFSSASAFDSNWTAFGSSPARYIKNEWWCSQSGNLVEIQSGGGGYYRVFTEGSPGQAFSVTVDRVRGRGLRAIRVDADGGNNPNTYQLSWSNSLGDWQCETPAALTGTVGSAGQITVFLYTNDNGQYRDLNVDFTCP